MISRTAHIISDQGIDRFDYIIGMPSVPPMAGIGALSSGMSPIMQSVVRIKLATEAAFCKAVRVTFVGSSTPISIMSPYWLV